jgi:hypothetical protein
VRNPIRNTKVQGPLNPSKLLGNVDAEAEGFQNAIHRVLTRMNLFEMVMKLLTGFIEFSKTAPPTILELLTRE